MPKREGLLEPHNMAIVFVKLREIGYRLFCTHLNPRNNKG